MSKRNIITVKDVNNRTMTVNGIDYNCITDIARQKNIVDPNGVIANWMRKRNTIEYLGLWETLDNSNFTPLESRGLEVRLASSRAKFATMSPSMSSSTCRIWRTSTLCSSTKALRRANDW